MLQLGMYREIHVDDNTTHCSVMTIQHTRRNLVMLQVDIYREICVDDNTSRCV